jgi:hypothetical protein
VREVIGGNEDAHFNPACAESIDQIVGPVVGLEVDEVRREVPCAGKSLDLLAVAENRRVAIELQYGEADPSHLGRLLGWYAPAVEATDKILVAESFPEPLLFAVRSGQLRNVALVRALAGWNQDGTGGIAFETSATSIESVQGRSPAAHENREREFASVALIGQELAKYDLRDSNAQGHVRLFPVREGCWATVRIRTSRVVLNIGSSAQVDFDAAAGALDTEWSAVGKGLYKKISDQVEAYAVDPDAVPGIASTIADLADDAEQAIDALIATIPEDDTDDGDQIPVPSSKGS